MKKILVRGGALPTDNIAPEELMNHNLYGTNVGNSLYLYGVCRALMTEDVEIISTRYKHAFSDEDIDYYNRECSAFILPLADAFRKDFIPELKILTNLVKRLNIPCIVIGVGTRASFDADPAEHLKHDDVVKNFINAVLEKSSIIGVRGNSIASYFKTLGYTEERDFSIIGCPSMYTYGMGLQVKSINISNNLTVSANWSFRESNEITEFIIRSMEQFDDAYMIWQLRNEFKLLYSGKQFLYNPDKVVPCRTMRDKMYLDNKIRSPLNVPTWLDFLRQMDLSFGSRIHGNIASIIAGTPTLVVSKDYRVYELAEYHHLPHLDGRTIDENTDILRILERTDFSSHLNYQRENFEKYKSFLDINGLDHIFKNDDNPQNTALDKLMNKIDYNPMVESLESLSREELLLRMETINNQHDIEIKKLIERNESLKKSLNRKSVKYSLNLANLIRKIKRG